MEPSNPRARQATLPIVARMLLLAAGLLLAAFVLRALIMAHGGSGLVVWMRSHAGAGHAGAAMLIGVGALCCAVGAPRQAIAFAAGALFAPVIAAGLALIAQLLGCVVSFYWSRWTLALPRSWNDASIRLMRRPFLATLGVRLLPVGNNLITNLIAGASAIPPLPFLLASAIGYAPQTLIFVLLGHGAAVGKTAQIIVGGGLLGVSIVCGIMLSQNRR